MEPAQRSNSDADLTTEPRKREDARADLADPREECVDLTTLPSDDHTYRLYPGIRDGMTRVESIADVHEAVRRAKVVAEIDGTPMQANVRTNIPQLKQEIAELDGRAFRVTHIFNTDRSSADMTGTLQRIARVAEEAQAQGRPEVVVRVRGERPAIVDRVVGYLEELNNQLREKAGSDGASRNFVVALKDGDPLPARTRAARVGKAETIEEQTAPEKKSDVIELSSRGDLKATLNEIRDRLRARHERAVEYAMQDIFNDPEDGAPSPQVEEPSQVHVRVKDLKAARALAKLKPLLVKEFAVDEESFDKDVLKVTYTRQVVAEREAERAQKATKEAEKTETQQPAKSWTIGSLFRRLWPW